MTVVPDDFKLTPQTNEINTSFASELLATIKLHDEAVAKKKPVLIAWTMRMPIGIHRQLSKAKKKHNISMTAIAVEAFRRILPALLSDAELAAAERESPQE